LVTKPVRRTGYGDRQPFSKLYRHSSADKVCGRINTARAELSGRGRCLRRFKMGRYFLVLTISAFVLTCGVLAANAQQVPDVPTMQQQPQNLQEQLQRQLQGTPSSRQVVRDDIEDDGWSYGPHWRQHQDRDRRYMGQGPMGGGAMVGSGALRSRMMMRMLFALMDGDGDGTVSLQEFQAAHERIFRAMDANKDGRLTPEEIQAFMQERRRSGQQQ
jgi:EF hand domain-containing protein